MPKSAVDKKVDNARRALEEAKRKKYDSWQIGRLERKLESAMFEKRMAKANAGRVS